MAFTNRIRLPFKLTRPQWLEERDIFRKANGDIKVLNVVIRKQYEGETDLLPKKIHERLIIALAHDDIRIEGEHYIGNIVKEGDYTINWVDFLDYPIAKATFKVLATPYNASNSNCGTCEEVIQIVTNDDNYGDATEGTVIYVDVLDNDEICCDPVTLTVTSINSIYVDSAGFLIVGFEQQLQIVLKSDVSTQNNVLLVTYRAQCANGQFDEANVYANITGTGDPVCLSPENLTVLETRSTEADLSWNTPAGVLSFEWKLYLATDLITPIDSGTQAGNTITLTGLDPSTEYVFTVRSVCADDEFSNYAQIDFTTNPQSGTQSCGNYRLCYFNGFEDANPTLHFNYIDCNGDDQFVIVNNFECENVCALQNSEGDPVLISPDGPFGGINYEGLC
jgi:hypothetical protein